MILRVVKVFGPLTVCIFLLLAGCDKDSDSASTLPPPEPPKPTRPTTQQLVNGPRIALDLKFVPLVLQTPDSWQVKTYEDGLRVMIEGDSPADTVQISVPAYRDITPEQEANLEAESARDFSQAADLLPKSGVTAKDLGAKTSGKLIELFTINPPAVPDAGTTQPIQTVQWVFTICIPTTDGKHFTAYELRFLGLTLAQYKADQAFLRTIVDSVSYKPMSDLGVN
jgi:hypothetical protein